MSPRHRVGERDGRALYSVAADEQVQHQIDALPADALASFAELRVLLEVSPWSGDPINDRNSAGPVRIVAFGRDRDGGPPLPALNGQAVALHNRGILRRPSQDQPRSPSSNAT